SYMVQMILQQPVALQRRMIFAAIERARCEFSLVQHKQIEASHVETVLSLLRDKASGKRVQLPEGLLVWREFDKLTFAPSSAASDEILLAANATEVVFGGFVITILRRQPVSALPEVIAKNQTGTDWLTVALDEAHLPAQLFIRSRRRGEKALAAGQRQAKKLKQLMIDRQIPVSERPFWAIVSTPNGQYIWSPMLPPEKVFLPGKTTKLIAILSASKKKRPLIG
ncbi:MAG TPA: tRNA lysidine(34) synthetase TilS, partial [Flavisolibacter sp.]|nr:tRNA lysidine(34) synthetase TilS [Flavisolibacter sp.]